MYQVTSKIKNCRLALSKWKNRFQTNSRQKIENIQFQLSELKKSTGSTRNGFKASLKRQLKDAYQEEEQYWQQKSRIQWLREGDKNTKYFHALVQGRRRRNRLNKLQRDNGTWTEGEEELCKEMEDYYRNLLNGNEGGDLTEVLDGIPHSITDEMNENLLKPVLEDEITSVVFSMNPDKAPGIDGMSPLFFQKFWTTIKQDVVNAIQTFFHTGYLLKSVNHTVITLIPKVLNPTSLKQFRPISLCTTMYKIIAKILANRIKSVLHCCICKNQSAFISGRQILDNIYGFS